MAIHPEGEGTPEAELQKFVESTEVVDVWCTGCNSWTKMNAAYARILKTGEISECGKCRKTK